MKKENKEEAAKYRKMAEEALIILGLFFASIVFAQMETVREIRALDLKKAVHSTFGDVSEKLLKEDKIYAQTYPQEWIEIYFDRLEVPKGERDFIFVSRGHYLYFEGDAAVRLKGY